jgi:hypothetical protein
VCYLKELICTVGTLERLLLIGGIRFWKIKIKRVCECVCCAFDVVSFNSETYHPSVYVFDSSEQEIPLQSLFTVGGMSRLSHGTWSHLMIDDLVRSLFFSFVFVRYVYQKRMVSLSQWGSLLAFVSAFLSHLLSSQINRQEEENAHGIY